MLETSIAIAIVVGLTEAVKKGFGINSRYAPLISLIFGIGIMFISGDLSTNETIMVGIIVGLSASGLYSGTKTTIKG